MLGKAWQWECGAAGHIILQLGNREMVGGCWSSACFLLLSRGPWSMGWCCSHSRLRFPAPLNPSGTGEVASSMGKVTFNNLHSLGVT